MEPVMVCGIDEEFPLFMTGMAYGAGVVSLFVVVPLLFYIRKQRKEIRKAWNETFEARERLQRG
jgi:hypothetical protein